MDFFDVCGISHIISLITPSCFKKEELKTIYKPMKFQFRPKTLDEFIGNESAKENITLTCQIILSTKPVHILLSGGAGNGKTTLAQIIGSMLGFTFKSYIGGSFGIEELREFLLFNEKSKQTCILFLDEIHGTKKQILEFMLPIIEDFKLNGVPIKKFILIGATTNKSILLKSCRPFVDRIGTQIQLANYTEKDIVKIIMQYNTQLYQKNVPMEDYTVLAKNTRFCPRIALSWFDMLIACGSVEKVLKINRIIKNGLTDDDIKILRHLAEIDKPVGEQALAVISNSTIEDYRLLAEPFLLQEGYLTRTGRGRLITNKGKEITKEGLSEKNI